MSVLPDGWEEPSLVDICEFNPKHDQTIDRAMGVSFVPMPAVNEFTGTIEVTETRSLSSIWKSYTHFADGDVIFAKITPCMENGKAAVASGLANGLACGSTEFHVLRPRGEIIPSYIWRFIRQETFRKDAESKMSGAVGQRRVPKPYLEQHLIPLPPLPEQQRIVKKLDTLSARSKQARSHLTAIKSLVERYKLAVLDAAFFKNMSAEVPTVSFVDALASTQNGLSKRGGGDGKPYKVLRLADLTGNRFDGQNPRSITLDENEAQKYRLSRGDLVIIRVNGSDRIVGRLIIWGDDTDWAYCDHFIRARVFPHVHSEYLHHFFETDRVRARIEATFVSSAGQKTVSKKILAQIMVPLPPLMEQREIVRRIETAFAKIDRLAAEAEKALKLTDRLDQRILAKAFAGELVPQDPNDEPASALLARIRAERACAPKAKRGRTKSAGA